MVPSTHAPKASNGSRAAAASGFNRGNQFMSWFVALSASQFHRLVATEMVNVFFLLVLDNTPYICRFLHVWIAWVQTRHHFFSVQGKHIRLHQVSCHGACAFQQHVITMWRFQFLSRFSGKTSNRRRRLGALPQRKGDQLAHHWLSYARLEKQWFHNCNKTAKKAYNVGKW